MYLGDCEDSPVEWKGYLVITLVVILACQISNGNGRDELVGDRIAPRAGGCLAVRRSGRCSRSGRSSRSFLPRLVPGNGDFVGRALCGGGIYYAQGAIGLYVAAVNDSARFGNGRVGDRASHGKCRYPREGRGKGESRHQVPPFVENKTNKSDATAARTDIRLRATCIALPIFASVFEQDATGLQGRNAIPHWQFAHLRCAVMPPAASADSDQIRCTCNTLGVTPSPRWGEGWGEGGTVATIIERWKPLTPFQRIDRRISGRSMQPFR